jgi:hypothetical protein
MHPRSTTGLYVSLLTAFCTVHAQAWWGGGHQSLTRASVTILSDDMPAYFRQAGPQVAHMSMDPDVVKHRKAPFAYEAEHAEHYLDLELLQGRGIPPTRNGFLALCCELGVAPTKVGALPYAVAEWTERLAMAFAEHRAWPKNDMVRQKSFVYAGFLAHYAQDLCQPLHTTIYFDGRAGTDGTSPRSGIHEKVDGLVENLGARPDDVAKGVAAATVDSLMPFILAEFRTTHALVDTVYAMENLLPSAKGTRASATVLAFATERMQRAIAVTAGLYAYAWRLSEQVELEAWIQR